MTGFYRGNKYEKLLKNLYGFISVHNLVVIHLNSTKLGQMTNYILHRTLLQFALLLHFVAKSCNILRHYYILWRNNYA